MDLGIGSPADAGDASGRARAFAAELGFAERSAEEIALVVREMAMNVLHHGGGGTLALRRVEEDGRTGLEVEAVNPGPPIRDVEGAFRDGFSTRGSFGYGLGTVNRLMHGVDVESPLSDGSGTRVVARRWLYRDLNRAGAFLDAGAASRAHPGVRENGDAVVITSWDAQSLVGVIDGLGHGPPARQASRAAATYVVGHAREPLERVFEGVDRACRGSRGVVMALVRFDWAAETVTVGNVGNVDIRVFGTSERLGLRVRRGFLGRGGARPAVSSVPWPRDATMVLYTDGIRNAHLGQVYRERADDTPQRLARTLLDRLARDRDDATAVVLRRKDV